MGERTGGETGEKERGEEEEERGEDEEDEDEEGRMGVGESCGRSGGKHPRKRGTAGIKYRSL